MTNDISALRAEIDKIDDTLIRLLNERSEFVKKVGAIKKQAQAADASFIRSGREAEMVRRIARAFKGGVFPPAAAAQIWRIIICASLSLESQLSVTVFAPEAQAELYWLAREYFGHFIPVMKEPTARRVIGNLIDGKTQVCVLPLPDSSPEGKWWLKLPEAMNVFACVPFLISGNAPVKALAVAKVEPEPTGDDASLVSIETVMEVSQSRLKSLFDKQKLDVRWLATESFTSDNRAHLFEIKGFVRAQDASLQALAAELGASLLALRVLGAYALPLSL